MTRTRKWNQINCVFGGRGRRTCRGGGRDAFSLVVQLKAFTIASIVIARLGNVYQSVRFVSGDSQKLRTQGGCLRQAILMELFT